MRMVLVLALLTACIWLVGNLVLVGLVAPTLFAHAPADITRAQAGLLFGDLLMRWIGIVDLSLWLALTVLLALIAGYLLKLQRRGLMLASVLALAGLATVHLWSRATVHEARSQRPTAVLAQGPAQLLPDEQHAAFAAVHQRSETLFAAETLLLALVVLATAVACMVHKPGTADPEKA